MYLFLTVTAHEIFKLQASRTFAIALQVSYAALGIMMIGILFILMGWPKSELLIYAGCAVTGVMFLYFTYKMYFGTLDDEGHRIIINNLTVRMLPALLVAAFLIAMYLKT